MPATIKASDLPPDVRKKLNLRKAPSRKMTMDVIRGEALRTLAVIAYMTQAERTRVLKHAQKLNEV
jgi:hypothetical protein